MGWIGQQRGRRVYIQVFVLEVSGPILPTGEEGGREGEEMRKGGKMVHCVFLTHASKITPPNSLWMFIEHDGKVFINWKQVRERVGIDQLLCPPVRD